MPGAGSGTRLGAALPKALIDLNGSPLFARSAEPFLRHSHCVEAIFAAPAGCEGRFAKIAGTMHTAARIQVVAGGETRQDSVAKALQAMTGDADLVLIHDAARPFISGALIQRILDAMTGETVAALPGLLITDTVKRISGTPLLIIDTVDRSDLVTVQTPQAIRTGIARRAHQLAAEHSFQATDDVALIEHFRLGPIRIVDGEPGNFKITTETDLDRARDLLLDRFKARDTAG